MKDLIGNKIAVGDKVQVYLPQPHLFGFIAEIREVGRVSALHGSQASVTPGHVLVSCVVALPVDVANDAVAQIVKVHDPSKAASEASQGGVDASKPN